MSGSCLAVRGRGAGRGLPGRRSSAGRCRRAATGTPAFCQFQRRPAPFTHFDGVAAQISASRAGWSRPVSLRRRTSQAHRPSCRPVRCGRWARRRGPRRRRNAVTRRRGPGRRRRPVSRSTRQSLEQLGAGRVEQTGPVGLPLAGQPDTEDLPARRGGVEAVEHRRCDRALGEAAVVGGQGDEKGVGVVELGVVEPPVPAGQRSKPQGALGGQVAGGVGDALLHGPLPDRQIVVTGCPRHPPVRMGRSPLLAGGEVAFPGVADLMDEPHLDRGRDSRRAAGTGSGAARAGGAGPGRGRTRTWARASISRARRWSWARSARSTVHSAENRDTISSVSSSTVRRHRDRHHDRPDPFPGGGTQDPTHRLDGVDHRRSGVGEEDPVDGGNVDPLAQQPRVRHDPHLGGGGVGQPRQAPTPGTRWAWRRPDAGMRPAGRRG